MTSTAPTGQLSTHGQQRRRLLLPGLAAAAAAAVTVTTVAALAMAVGVDFELPDGGKSIPLVGFTQLTFTLSVVGILIALAIRRWASQPARTWVVNVLDGVLLFADRRRNRDPRHRASAGYLTTVRHGTLA